MTGPVASTRPTAKRSIHFYRIDGGADESGRPIPVDLQSALSLIDGLPFEEADGRYLAQKDGDFYCLWVNRIGEVSEIAFGLIRRNALPQSESAGKLKNLILAEKEGLCEVSHMCLFPSGIVGVEYNHYGPRASRFPEYVTKITKGNSPFFAVEALMNHDVAEKIARKVAVRILELKVRRPYIDAIKEMHLPTGEALESLARGSEADTVGIMLGPEPWQKINLGNSMMDFIRRMVRRPDLREIAVKFTASMVEEGKDKPDEINLLQDHLITSRKILKIGERSRVLDSNDAYKQIQAAYEGLRQDLLSAPSVSVDRVAR